MEKPSEGVFTLVAVLLLLGTLVGVLRLIAILPAANPLGEPQLKGEGRKAPPMGTSLLILLGSGGHTGEMLRILSQWEHLDNYDLHFVISSGDSMSLLKLKEMNFLKYSVNIIHRARDVGHGKVSAFINTLISFKSCFGLIWTINPKVFLSNGPGSAIPLAYTMFLMKFLGVAKDNQIVYVESLARVEHLSLTGHLILPICTRILVQWPQLAKKYPRCEYKGILV